MYLADKLQNLVANLGTARDKASVSAYVDEYMDDAQLIAAYRSSWLARKIIDIPAKDSCRKWRQWQAESDQISAIEAEETRLGLKAKVVEARVKARLFGGSGIYIGVGDTLVDQPINVDRSPNIEHLTVMSRRQLIAGPIDNNPLSEMYGRPMHYEVQSQSGAVRIHPSRLVLFFGGRHPDEQLQNVNQGWGDSILQWVLNSCKQADSAIANVASLVFEASVDVLKIPGLMQNIADKNYEERLLKRLNLAMTAKGINGALIIDSEEGYEKKSSAFGNLDKIMDRFFLVASGAADIPMVRLFGQSAAGMNATGEGDIRNYYDMVSSEQELEMGPAMSVLDEILIRSALGERPPEVHYNWSSLWQPTDKELAEIGSKNADTIKKLAETEIIPEEALSSAAVNMMTESGVMPGLEQAVNEHFSSGGDDNDDEILAAANDSSPMGQP